jgi:hypothetical protein
LLTGVIKEGLISHWNESHDHVIASRAHRQRIQLTDTPDSFGHAFDDRSDLF